MAILKDRTVWLSFVIVENDSDISTSDCQYFVSATETYTSYFAFRKNQDMNRRPVWFIWREGWRKKDPFALPEEK